MYKHKCWRYFLD